MAIGVLGSGFSVPGSRFGVLGPRKWYGIVSGLPRDRFEYVSTTCRLRLVYVSFTCLTRIKQVKTGVEAQNMGLPKLGDLASHSRGNLEEISNQSRTILGVVKSKARFMCLCTREIMYDLRQIWENGAKNGLMDLLIRAKCLLFRICPCTYEKNVILLHPFLNTRI